MRLALSISLFLLPCALFAAGSSDGTLGIDERKRAHKLTNLLIKEGRLSEAEAWVQPLASNIYYLASDV